MQTSNIQVRVDTKLKKQAEKILDNMGMDMATLLRMTLKRLVLAKNLPFPLGTSEELDENGFTKKQQKELDKAIKELDNPKKKHYGPFKNMDEAIKFLNNT